MSHGTVANYGFIVQLNSQVVGYSGDTGRCDNLDKLIELSDHAFIDTTFMKSRETHTGVDFLKEIAPKFSETKKLYAIHIGDETENVTSILGVILPKSGDEYQL